MMSKYSFALRLVTAALLALAPAALAQTTTDEFTIIALPDTQFYSKDYPHILSAQTKWIADQAETRKIRLVVGLGDIVNGGGELGQWQNASAAYSALDGTVPYVLPLGNHDYDRNDPANRTASTKNYNSYFGPGRYTGYSWYGESWPAGSNENYYARLTIHGQKYLVMALEYAPRDAALQWAASVASSHPGHQIIVVTHSYMQSDDRRITTCYKYTAPYYNVTDYNEGDAIWNTFLSQHPNIILVLSGHSTAADGVGRRADVGVHGNLVNQILSNYQHYPQGGGGYLRILRVRPALNRIEVSTYSPFLDSWLTDARHQFTVPLNHPSPQSSATGALDGIVRQNCQPVADATVTTKAGSVTTNSSGYYKLDLPAPDVYSVEAAKGGTDGGSTVVQPSYTSALDLFLSEPADFSSCVLSATDPSLTVCSPAIGASVSSPVRFLAGTTSSSPVHVIQIYVDGAKQYEVLGGTLDTSLDLPAGTRYVTVQALNQAGVWFRQSMTISVAKQSASTGTCALGSTDPSVTICSPANGASVSSPVRFVAGTTSSSPVHVTQIYVDGTKRYEVLDNKLDATLDLPAGTRYVTVQALNHAGVWFQERITVSVASSETSDPGTCTLSTTDRTVTICAPAAESTTGSPVRIIAGTTSSLSVNLIQIYVDGGKQYEAKAGKLDTTLSMAAGYRRVTVQARDSAGNWFKKTVYVTVD